MDKYLIKTLAVFLVAILASNSSFAQNGLANAVSNENDPKMNWWHMAKFGMFIHWGIYSVPAGKYNDDISQGEWIMNRCRIPLNEYKNYARKFNPTKFNAEEWVLLAKAAGQKYIVITAKHHDGFAMFKSAASAYNVYDATPFKRDPLKELADACRKYGIKLGFYYSQAQDWSHKGGAAKGGHWDKVAQDGSMDKYIDSIAVPQVKELLTNYGDIAELWWDTPNDMDAAKAKKLAELIKLQPGIITNNRLGGNIGGDLETPEQFIPSTGFPGKNWEVCMTMNEHWGYNAYDENWKSSKDILYKLIDITSKGGNFLLNVGPTSEGIIPQVCVNTLKDVGTWLQINGDAIYGTTASPFNYLSWGRATRKGQKVYLHVFNWPKSGLLKIPFTNKVVKAYLMEDSTELLNASIANGKVVLRLPKYAPDKIASVIVVEFKGEPMVEPKLTDGVLAVASSEAGQQMGIRNIFDGNPKSTWSAAIGTKKATIVIDLKQAKSLGCFSIVEPWYPWDHRTQKIILEYKLGEKWKTLFEGDTNGTGQTESFKPVDARYLRLSIVNDIDAPKLSELILYPTAD